MIGQATSGVGRVGASGARVEFAEWIVDGAPSFDRSDFHYQRFQRPEGPLSIPTPLASA